MGGPWLICGLNEPKLQLALAILGETPGCYYGVNADPSPLPHGCMVIVDFVCGGRQQADTSAPSKKDKPAMSVSCSYYFFLFSSSGRKWTNIYFRRKSKLRPKTWAIDLQRLIEGT